MPTKRSRKEPSTSLCPYLAGRVPHGGRDLNFSFLWNTQHCTTSMCCARNAQLSRIIQMQELSRLDYPSQPVILGVTRSIITPQNTRQSLKVWIRLPRSRMERESSPHLFWTCQGSLPRSKWRMQSFSIGLPLQLLPSRRAIHFVRSLNLHSADCLFLSMQNPTRLSTFLATTSEIQ